MAHLAVQYVTFGVCQPKLVGNWSVKGKVTHWEKNGSVNAAVKCFSLIDLFFAYIVCLFMITAIINNGNFPVQSAKKPQNKFFKPALDSHGLRGQSQTRVGRKSGTVHVEKARLRDHHHQSTRTLWFIILCFTYLLKFCSMFWCCLSFTVSAIISPSRTDANSIISTAQTVPFARWQHWP